MKQRERDESQDANRITSIIATNRVVGGEVQNIVYLSQIYLLPILCSNSGLSTLIHIQFRSGNLKDPLIVYFPSLIFIPILNTMDEPSQILDLLIV